MKKILIVVAVLVSGCTKDGGAYVCSSEDGSFNAEAQVSRFSGDIVRYRAVDYNGIGFDIDHDNSLKFDCITKAEHDKIEAQKAAQLKTQCERGKKDKNPWFDDMTC